MKWTLIIILLMLIMEVNAFETSSANYKTNIVISPSDILNSTNYKTKVGIIDFAETVNSANYISKIGFYNLATLDEIQPNLTLIEPINKTYFSSSDIPLTTFKYNVTDNIKVKNCTLYVHSMEKSKTTSITQTQNEFSGHYLEIGADLRWEITCYDYSGNSVNSFHLYTFERAEESGGAYSEPEPAGSGGFIIAPLPKYNFTVNYLCTRLKYFISDHTINGIFGFDKFDLEELSIIIKEETGNDIDIYTLSRYLENYDMYCITPKNVTAKPFIEITNETIFIPLINLTINKTKVKNVLIDSYIPMEFKIGNLNATPIGAYNFVNLFFPVVYNPDSNDVYAKGFRIITWVSLIMLITGFFVGVNIVSLRVKVRKLKSLVNKDTFKRLIKKTKKSEEESKEEQTI